MATLVPKNPKLVSSATALVKRRIPCAGSVTWKAGEFGVAASGLVTPIASNAVNIQYMFLEDQDSSSVAEAMVYVLVLDVGQIYEGFELDGTLANANIGEDYGVDVTSNIFTVDVGDTSNKAIKIVNIASTYEPSRNVTADVKARCQFRFLSTVVNA